MSDGIAIDKNGRVILTDVEHGGIMAFNPTAIAWLLLAFEILFLGLNEDLNQTIRTRGKKKYHITY